MNILNKKSGFTLTEVLVIVIVIGILAAAGVPYYKDHLERQKAAIGITDLRMIADSVERYLTLHPDATPELRLLDIDIEDDEGTYNNGNFTFSIKDSYIIGERNTGEYNLRFTLGDEPKLCCHGNDNICSDKLNLESC